MIKRALIIDDNEDILEALQIVFEASGYQVAAHLSGNQADDVIEAFRPDVIVLDMQLPGVNGLTICNSLKNNTLTKKIPIVMISAHPEAKNLSIAAGADAYVSKPFEVEDLLVIVDRVTQKTSITQ